MILPSDTPSTSRAAAREPVVSSRHPWRAVTLADGARCWLSGYTTGATDESAATALRDALVDGDAALRHWAETTLGHGAAILVRADVAVGITDVIGSVPLFIKETGDGPELHSTPKTEDGAIPDHDAALQLAMSGFTIGRRCLSPELTSIRPGEIAIIKDGSVRYSRYLEYIGAPDDTIDPNDPYIQEEHNNLLLSVLEGVARAAKGGKIMVPLSAGLDSRAILCGLRELGYENIGTFSYGLPNNHEIRGAEKVARTLGASWHLIPYDRAEIRRFFQGETARDYFQFADRPDAMPFIQDVPALERLLAETDVPSDAHFVNGQSGDFIAGNHIPDGLDQTARSFQDAIMAKHFDFWKHLKSPSNTARIQIAIDEELASLSSEARAFIRYERFEYDTRQSKYVVAGQRAYEFYGFNWRLPFWDARLVKFWRRMPLAAKSHRYLFRTSMEAANWGGVWGSNWLFPRTVVPRWLTPLRATAKLAHVPLGRDRWHRFEKNTFDWVMDPVQNYAIAPYQKVLRDRRGFRNALAWHGEAYLARHGVQIDTLAATGQSA